MGVKAQILKIYEGCMGNRIQSTAPLEVELLGDKHQNPIACKFSFDFSKPALSSQLFLWFHRAWEER